MTLETPFIQRDGEVGFQERLQKRQITICSHDKGTIYTKSRRTITLLIPTPYTILDYELSFGLE
jgi:hypothetical protein